VANDLPHFLRYNKSTWYYITLYNKSLSPWVRWRLVWCQTASTSSRKAAQRYWKDQLATI